MDTKNDRIFSSFFFSSQTIEIPMPYSLAKLEQLFFLSLSIGRGYKPEGKSPEVEEKLSDTHLLIRSGDLLPPEFALLHPLTE